MEYDIQLLCTGHGALERLEFEALEGKQKTRNPNMSHIISLLILTENNQINSVRCPALGQNDPIFDIKRPKPGDRGAIKLIKIRMQWHVTVKI